VEEFCGDISGRDLWNIAVPINSKDEIKLACREESGNLLQATLFY
jgi:hypothetical protein